MITEDEATMFSCPVERQRGDADSVTITWMITETIANRDIVVAIENGDIVAADEDFVNATGELVFLPGERNHVRLLCHFGSIFSQQGVINKYVMFSDNTRRKSRDAFLCNTLRM